MSSCRATNAKGSWSPIGVGHPDHPNHAKSLAAKMTPARLRAVGEAADKLVAFQALGSGDLDPDYLSELLTGQVAGAGHFSLTEEEAAVVRRGRRLFERVRDDAKAVRS